MSGARRKGRIGRNMKVAGLGLASLGVVGAMTLAGAQAAWALPGGGGPGIGGPGTGGPSPCAGAASPPSQTGCTAESLLYYANSTGEPAIVPGQSVSVYYLDETPYDTSIVQVFGAGGNMVEQVTPTATPVSGSNILNYTELTAFDYNGGSQAPFPRNGNLTACPTPSGGHSTPGPADCEDLLTFTIPTSGLTPGQSYTARITTYDYDGNSDQFTLSFKDPAQEPTPVGAVGGALLAVAMGGGLVYVQQRRRRGAARRSATAQG
jgi:hypothetical protein